MKTNLSSQIKLDRIPKRYYAPDGELELAALTRDEKVYTKIFEGSEEGSVYVAHDVAELIQKCKAEHRHCVLDNIQRNVQSGVSQGEMRRAVLNKNGLDALFSRKF